MDLVEYHVLNLATFEDLVHDPHGLLLSAHENHKREMDLMVNSIMSIIDAD